MVSVELEHVTTRKKEVCYFKLSGRGTFYQTEKNHSDMESQREKQ